MSAKNVEIVAESGSEHFIPLNKLKKSPNNARKTPHSEATIEAYAASIAAKGILQNLVVEPELDADGAATGFYFVTIGEGRRLAQLLRLKRKEIKKTEPIRCIVDTANDPHEISLDENVTRENMHPADQFEAFKKLAEERGYGAEEIAARFGVTPHVVRPRLRLGAVSPKLMQVYRNGELTLEQLMAFAIAEDHARQEAVYERLSYNRDASTIRRMLTETNVAATDRRAIFVGAEAGDELLIAFAEMLRQQTRTTEVVARIGGEEFVVLMPHTDLEQGLATAERIRAMTTALRIDSMSNGVTASFGVAELAVGEDGSAFMRRVDKALYEAKHSGRDRVVAAVEHNGPQTAVSLSNIRKNTGS